MVFLSGTKLKQAVWFKENIVRFAFRDILSFLGYSVSPNDGRSPRWQSIVLFLKENKRTFFLELPSYGNKEWFKKLNDIVVNYFLQGIVISIRNIFASEVTGISIYMLPLVNNCTTQNNFTRTVSFWGDEKYSSHYLGHILVAQISSLYKYPYIKHIHVQVFKFLSKMNIGLNQVLLVSIRRGFGTLPNATMIMTTVVWSLCQKEGWCSDACKSSGSS